jgi:hypothetical protein
VVLAQPVAELGLDRAEVNLLPSSSARTRPARMAVWVITQRSRSFS